ncbi:MAG TPA: hypothetical protein VFH43_11810, partial [Candidatus Kapabacteria bacterium]|nr:hypothetical protein [Candidatus Kapabacteria bacterium]
PIRFAFSPTEVREYRARAWVHSSSRALAYVDFVGFGGLMSVDIIPKEINFGRVRLDKDTSRNYSVLFSGEDNLAKVTLLPYGYANLQTPELGFNVPAIARSEHEAGTAYTSSVTFKPLTEGWRDTGFNVYALLPQKLQDTQKLHVRLIGRGVMPNVETEDEIFGDVRIDRFTAFREIEVRNLGSDTTQIVSIELDPDDSDFDDFTLDPSTIPSPERFLDTVGVDGSRITYRARFNPNDTGHKEIMVRIKTLEQTVYSKLTGRGVEPYIVATPPVLDFGVIDATIPGVDLTPEKTFSIANIGTYEGIVYNLRQTETGKEHFVLRPITPSETIVDEIVAMRGNVDVEVTFNAKRVGQFLDTVFIANDTRNQPFVILKGIVKTDIVITPTEVEFDTIRDCDPVIVTVRIDNPNTVGIEIDTVYFEGDTAGFSFAEVFNVDLIRIEAGSFFEIKVKYIFPADRLSGDQTAKLVFYQYIGYAVVRREVILHLYRDIKTLSLTTVKPSYTPSASDAQLFRLTIKIVGEREGLEELDNFDLVLRFDNDLFEAVGVDLVGSLAEAPPGQVSRPIYDPVEKTYTITGRGLDVSKRKGDLLLTVLVETYLTVDTFATVTPELKLSQRPCAYGIAKQGVLLEYANDCGDELLRDKLRDEKAFKIVGVHPDPLVTSSSSTVNFNYVLGYDAELHGEVISTSGTVLYQLPPIQAATGEGTLLVPASALPASGSYILRITQRPTSDPAASEQTFSRMFRVVR